VPTNGLGVLWGLLPLVMLWQMPVVSQTVLLVSLFPAYDVIVSFALEFRRRSSR